MKTFSILLLAGILGSARAAPISQDLPPTSGEAELSSARSLLASGQLQEAEKAARTFIASHPNSPDAHRLLGYALFKQNEPKESLSEYVTSGRYAPLGAPEFEVMGCDYFLLEDYAAADEWLTRAVQSGNKESLTLYLLGRTKYNERHFQEALDYFKRALAVDPRDMKAETYLGRAYEEMDQTDNALAAYRVAVELDAHATQEDPAPYLALGTLLVEKREPADAARYLTKAVQLAPKQAEAERELGKAHLALNLFADARADLEQAVALEPENAPTHFLLAQVYQKLGMAKRAAEERATYGQLTSNHSSPEDPLSEARALVEAGKIAEAERVTRTYLDFHKNSSDAHFLLGYVLFRKQDAKASLAEYTEGAKYRRPSAADLEAVGGDYVLLHDYADADKWFTQSLQWDPGNWQTLYYLGRAKYNENRFDEAVDIFRKCLQLQPKNIKAEDNLGLALEGLNRTEEAIEAYNKAIEWQAGSQNQDAEPYLDLGSALVTHGHASDAIAYLRQGLAISPNDVRIHRELGKAYTYLDELPQAQAELEKSVQLAPDSAPTHFVLAQVYRKLGMADKARAEIERFTALNGADSTQP